MSEVSANSSSNIIKVSEIGMAFGKEYYTVLSREPSRLHLFYAKNSTLLHADEGDLDTPISIGSEAIQNAVNKNSFLGSRFIIGSIDCHPSQNGGILVNVLGQIQKRGQVGSTRHFMQTFFLAEQPSGYFILNDNLRFLERPTTSTPSTPVTTTAAAAPASVTESVPAAPAVKPVESAPVVPVAEPVAAPVVAEQVAPATTETATAPVAAVEAAPVAETAAPAKVKKITTAASKQKASSTSASPTLAPAAPVEEEVPAAGPSSWAQLAAVQQNKWASGVVSHNKGLSIPSEEKPKTSSSAIKVNNRKTEQPTTSSSTAAASTTPRRTNNTDSKPSKLPFVPEASLYVTGVTDNLKADVIRAEFAALGALAHFDVKYNSGAAFVEYVDPNMAKILLEEGGIVVNGTRLTVEKRRVISRNSHSSDNLKDKDAAAKKFTPTKSNRRERPANKTASTTTA